MPASSLTAAPGHQAAYWDTTRLAGTRVYVVRAGDEAPVKVGIARNVADRIATLQTGNWRKLHVLYSLPGDLHLEKHLHLEMANDRIIGEWFEGPSVEPTLEWLQRLGEWLKAGFEKHRPFLPDWRGFDGAHIRTGAGYVRVRHVDPSTLPPFRSKVANGSDHPQTPEGSPAGSIPG